MKPLIGAGRPASRAADQEEALVARLTALAPALDGEPDAEWQAGTRARLVAMAAVRSPEPQPVSPLRRLLARREGRPGIWRTRLTAGLAGVATAVTGVAAVVTLSEDARPGDALYGIKRGTERTQLALAGDARGSTLLGFASTRLEELSVGLPDGPSAELVEATLATMDAQTSDGAAWLARRAVDTGTSAPLDELIGWSAGQSAELADVGGQVPAAVEDDVADSVALLARIEERVDGLRVALDCPSGPAIAGSDALGPVPGTCRPPAPSVGGNDPGAPVSDQPGTTAAPTPGSPTAGSDDLGAPGGGTGSGGSHSATDGSAPGSGSDPGSGSASGSGPGSGSGSADPGSSAASDLPDAQSSTPETPGVPVPSLPTVPDGSGQPPAAGTAGGSSAGTETPPALDLCLPPLPAVADC